MDYEYGARPEVGNNWGHPLKYTFQRMRKRLSAEADNNRLTLNPSENRQTIFLNYLKDCAYRQPPADDCSSAG